MTRTIKDYEAEMEQVIEELKDKDLGSLQVAGFSIATNEESPEFILIKWFDADRESHDSPPIIIHIDDLRHVVREAEKSLGIEPEMVQ